MINIKYTVDVEKMIELEKWLLRHYNDRLIDPNSITRKLDVDTLISILAANKFFADELLYLIDAYYLPIGEIMNDLDNSSSIKVNSKSLEFTDFLASKYGVEREIIIRRLKQIRSIKKYLKKHPDINFPEIQIVDKLVRDRIPEIIESSGETAVFHTLRSNEYWDYLLQKDKEELEDVRKAETKDEIKNQLADKLEVIRAMAQTSGLTLDDIIREADKKRHKKGGFSKRLVLERTYRASK